MNVDFLHMRLQDFKSFKGKHELRLGPDRGLWFVRGRNRDEKRLGSNGAGKSSLWDALCWCLYGVTPRGLRNPDVRPWRPTDRATAVTVLVQVGKRRVPIMRSTHPNRITIAGKPVGNEAIVKLIGMPFEVLTNTIVLGQGGELFFDLSPTEKLNLLSEVKQLDRWDGRSVQASAQAKKLEAEVATVEGELIGLEAGRRTLALNTREAEKASARWAKEQAKVEKVSAKVVAKLKRQVDELEKQESTFDLKYDGAMTEVKACERRVSEIGIDLTNAKIELSERRSKRMTAKQCIKEYKARLRKLREAKRCPTCDQLVTQKNLAAHRKEIKAGLAEWEAKLAKVKFKALRTRLDTCESNLKHEKSYLNSFHTKGDAALQQLKQVQGVLADVRSELKVATAAKPENPYTQALRSAKQRLRAFDEDMEGARKDKVVFEKKLLRAQGWTKGFREIKLHVLEEFLQELEITTAGMLEEVGLVGWSVKYQIERELKSGKMKRGLTILIGSPRSKGLVKWESWSGGEGQRLRVVGALALATVLLNHAGVEPNIEVLDEPTQHMSPEGVDDLCEFLADRARSTGRRIFYADQQSVESARFAGVVTVRRTNKGSTIKVSSDD